MRATDIIIKKRGSKKAKGLPLKREEISFIVDGYVKGEIPDYQMSSFLMAVFCNGMTFEETGYLTNCMLHSGDVINLYESSIDGLKGPFVDKHSTGGVGDKISLPLAPIVASCGVQIPMMSGRGLGHTGGTLDKLESVDGYNVRLDPKTFAELIAKTGYAMTGQTDSIAPADKKMYALRDVTGTVESVPLITSSILSKKVAEGSDALVFDVKCGRGAFMKSQEDAEELATFLVKTSQAMGKKALALLTKMEAPLGRKTGNFLEMEETVECLQGKGPLDVMRLTYELGSRMLMLGGKANTVEEGIELCRASVSSGKALEKFLENIRDQGGNPEKFMSQLEKRRSPFRKEVAALEDGYLDIDAYGVGLSCITLGVGRTKSSDSVCPDAGIIFHGTQGQKTSKGDVIMEVFAKDENSLENGVQELLHAVSIKEDLFLCADQTLDSLIVKEIK